MKKYLCLIVALTLCLCLLVVGCQIVEDESEVSDYTSVLTTQSDEDENTQQIENDLLETQIVTGTNICEYEDYIFYRNTNDNGSLYRYNTKDDSYIRLFDKNVNAFLHSISVYDDYVYFVTRAESDTTPTLYKVHINGGEAECLFDNVGDDYIITEDAIYYTDYSNRYGIFALHKYTFANQKDILLQKDENTYLILKGNKIFFTSVRYLEMSFEISLNYLDIENDSIHQVDIGDMHDIHYATSRNGCKNVFFVAYYDINKPCLASCNTQTNEITVLSEVFDSFHRVSIVSDDLVYFQAKKDGKQRIYQCYKGEVSVYADLEGSELHSIETFDDKPILFATNNSGGEKILGDERLNVVVQE